MSPAIRADARPGPLDRLLRLFTDVRAGEAGTALLLALNVFILLTCYSVLKVLREPLILAAPGGAELKAYSAAGQALVLVFSLMIIAQFWSFANDLYTTDEGKRLFPIVALGGSFGALTGSFVTGVLIKPLGLPPLFLVAAGLLAVAALITNAVDARERRRTEAAVPDAMSSGVIPAATLQIRSATGEFKQPGEQYITASGTIKALKREDLERLRNAPANPPPAPSGASAFALVLNNRYLLAIAFLLLLLNCVNSTGEYVLGKTLTQIAGAEAARTGTTAQAVIGVFYSGYQTAVNLVALVLQLFVVARVIKYAGVRLALLALPLIAFAGYAIMAFVPVLLAVRWAKIAENATDYSLNNTVRQSLFLPTTREEKYAAKQAIDGFFVRMGDVAQALLVFAGTHLLAMGARQFAFVNLVLVVVWIALAVAIGRRYERLVAASDQ